MDYRCPACKADLGKRKATHALVARMEIDCSHCGRMIRLNIHRAEAVVVMLNFATVVVLGASAYWLRSETLVLSALGAAMLGALALPVLEHTYLRNWPRYVTKSANS